MCAVSWGLRKSISQPTRGIELKGFYPQNFFLASLVLAVAIHFFIFEFFLFGISEKKIDQDKGFSFLGSILDSSQMAKQPLIKQLEEREEAPFSFHVPPRSERNYFVNIKDVEKPRMRAVSRKNDPKSVFVVSVKRNQPAKPQWNPEPAQEYRSLQIPVSP